MGHVNESGKISARLPPHLVAFVNEQIDQTGGDITDVIVSALNFHRSHLNDPEILKERIREILRDDPSLLDEPLRKIAIQRLQEPAFSSKPRQ